MEIQWTAWRRITPILKNTNEYFPLGLKATRITPLNTQDCSICAQSMGWNQQRAMKTARCATACAMDRAIPFIGRNASGGKDITASTPPAPARKLSAMTYATATAQGASNSRAGEIQDIARKPRTAALEHSATGSATIMIIARMDMRKIARLMGRWNAK